MKQKGISALLAIIIFLIVGVGGYVLYKSVLPKINSVIPSPAGSANPNQTPSPISGLPTTTEPKAGVRVVSPVLVRGIVPPGWMFEGVFPIKIVDSNKKLIVSGQAKEELPGSWQSGEPVYFTSTLSFTTSAKWGFIVLENDNPSGNPASAETYAIEINFSCVERPACLDATPRCMIPETSDMCPPSTTPYR